jgi:hypothetical protein
VGRIPAQQDPYTKHHLIPEDPQLLEHLRARVGAQRARRTGVGEHGADGKQQG